MVTPRACSVLHPVRFLAPPCPRGCDVPDAAAGRRRRAHVRRLAGSDGRAGPGGVSVAGRAAVGPGRPCAGGRRKGRGRRREKARGKRAGRGEASAAAWWPGSPDPVTESGRGDRLVWSVCVSVRLKELLVCRWKYRCGGVRLF